MSVLQSPKRSGLEQSVVRAARTPWCTTPRPGDKQGKPSSPQGTPAAALHKQAQRIVLFGAPPHQFPYPPISVNGPPIFFRRFRQLRPDAIRNTQRHLEQRGRAEQGEEHARQEQIQQQRTLRCVEHSNRTARDAGALGEGKANDIDLSLDRILPGCLLGRKRREVVWEAHAVCVRTTCERALRTLA